MSSNSKAHVLLTSGISLPLVSRTKQTQDYELRAPAGRYRVMLSGKSLLGDYTNLRAATEVARAHGALMKPAWIYDDQGRVLAKFAS